MTDFEMINGALFLIEIKPGQWINPAKIVQVRNWGQNASAIRLDGEDLVVLGCSPEEVVRKIAELVNPMPTFTQSERESATILDDFQSEPTLGTPTGRNRGLGALFPQNQPGTGQNNV